MRPNRQILALTVGACVVAATPAGAAQKPKPKLVTVIGTPDVVVDVTEPHTAQRIPVRLGKGVKASTLKVKVLLARKGTNRSASLVKRFEAKLDPTSTPDVIRVRVKKPAAGGKELGPGDYRLVLGARQGARKERIAIKLTVPAVVLTASPEFKVQQSDAPDFLSIIPLGGFEDRTTPTPRLILSPSSTKLTNLKITTVTQPPQGRIDFAPADSKATGLAPGGILALTPTVKGVSPGTHKGKVEVAADQLPTPTTFDYEVVVKRNGWWLVLLVAAGFLAGLAIRKGLVKLIAWLQAGRTAHDYAAELGDALAVAADSGFRRRLTIARNTLLTELHGFKTRPKIEAAVKKAKKSWTDAVAAYEAAHAEQSERLEKLVKELPAGTRIQAIDTVIDAAHRHAEEAATLLSGSDPAGAGQKITDATRLLSATLPTRVITWAENADALLDAVGRAPVVDRESLDGLVEAARKALDAVVADNATTAQMLDAANASLSPLGHVVRETRADVHTVVTKALDQIADSTLDPNRRPSPARLRQRLTELVTVLTGARIGDPTGLTDMVDALEALRTELNAQLKAWSPQPEAAAALLAEEPVVEALAEAILDDTPTATPTRAARSVARGTPPEGEARAAHSAPSPATGAAPPVAPLWVGASSSLNLFALLVAHAIRITVLTILFSAIGWLGYHQHFVGTTEEMLGIFLWAFTTDLTIAGVSTMASERKQAPPALPANVA